MTETVAPQAARTESPTYRSALVVSIIALVIGVLELAAGAVIWHLTDIDPSDDPLVSIGYVVALIVAVPGAIAVLLGALGWVFARRTAGLALGIVAAVAAAGPVLLALFFSY